MGLQGGSRCVSLDISLYWQSLQFPQPILTPRFRLGLGLDRGTEVMHLRRVRMATTATLLTLVLLTGITGLRGSTAVSSSELAPGFVAGTAIEATATARGTTAAIGADTGAEAGVAGKDSAAAKASVGEIEEAFMVTPEAVDSTAVEVQASMEAEVDPTGAADMAVADIVRPTRA